MQPFARPVARAVWGQARLSFDRTARPARFRRDTAASFQSCPLRSTIPAIVTRARFFSSQLPPKDAQDKGLGAGDAVSNDSKPPSNPEPAAESKASSPSRKDGESNDKPKPGLFGSNELPSTLEEYRSTLNRRFSNLMDTFQARTMNASQTLNDFTGYSSIDTIKHQNAELEIALADAHERVRSARQAYRQANTKRAVTQREVTALLARKDTWSPSDLERFTELYRTDHVLEGEVSGSQESLTEAEAEEQSLSQRLNAGMLKRYHEEQIWSDRIRRASTWGTWGLMGMNFVLFVILQFVAEPWKRRRLVKGVVAEEKAVLEEVRAQIGELRFAFEKMELAQAEARIEATPLPQETHVMEEVPVTSSIETTMEAPIDIPAEAPLDTPFGISMGSLQEWKEILLDPSQWRDVAEDLYSERRVYLRMRDASLLALEGAVAGAVLAGSIVLLLGRGS